MIRLYFAGSLDESTVVDCTYKKNLEKKIAEYGLTDVVTFLGEVDNMKRMRAKMDIELMCAWQETFGWVTVEGMRSGLIVIGSNTGATPEILSDNSTGLLYQQGNPESLADRIAWVISNKEEAREIAKCGYVFASSNYSVKDNALEVSAFLYDVIKGESTS